MNRPIPYQHPGKPSHVRMAPPGPPRPPVSLTPIAPGLVTGAIGRLPLTVGVYLQLPSITDCEPLARVHIEGRDEVLGMQDQRIVRAARTVRNLPQLILLDGAR
jgi:hypothetical protein